VVICHRDVFWKANIVVCHHEADSHRLNDYVNGDVVVSVLN
jgi:hypothetical protein